MSAAPRPGRDDAAADAELVGRCLDGDEVAWRTLVARHGGLVWNVARRTGLGSADAEDVVQTVWRIAIEDLARLRSHASVRPWLARTAHLQALRVLRGYGVARAHMPHVATSDADPDGPGDVVARVEEQLRVARAFEELGARCRDLLQLLYYESPRPSYEHVSRTLGMPIGSIGPTRARCLERLEKRLGGPDHATA